MQPYNELSKRLADVILSGKWSFISDNTMMVTVNNVSINFRVDPDPTVIRVAASIKPSDKLVIHTSSGSLPVSTESPMKFMVERIVESNQDAYKDLMKSDALPIDQISGNVAQRVRNKVKADLISWVKSRPSIGDVFMNDMSNARCNVIFAKPSSRGKVFYILRSYRTVSRRDLSANVSVFDENGKHYRDGTKEYNRCINQYNNSMAMFENGKTIRNEVLIDPRMVTSIKSMIKSRDITDQVVKAGISLSYSSVRTGRVMHKNSNLISLRIGVNYDVDGKTKHTPFMVDLVSAQEHNMRMVYAYIYDIHTMKKMSKEKVVKPEWVRVGEYNEDAGKTGYAVNEKHRKEAARVIADNLLVCLSKTIAGSL